MSKPTHEIITWDSEMERWKAGAAFNVESGSFYDSAGRKLSEAEAVALSEALPSAVTLEGSIRVHENPKAWVRGIQARRFTYFRVREIGDPSE